MLKIYFPLPNGKAFAFVARCGSTSIAASCLHSFYPDLYEKWLQIPDREHGGYAHRLLPHKVAYELPPGCLVIVRDPVDRFMSLCARTGTDPSLALVRVNALFGDKAPEKREQLETVSWDWMNHFRPISTIAQADSKLVQFERISDAFLLLGCSESVHVNAVAHDTDAAGIRAAVLDAYRADQILRRDTP
jgi:hypothetical protein